MRMPSARPSETGGLRRTRLASSLLRHALAGSAELGGKVLELRQAIPHRQHRLGVVDVHTRLERQRRQRGGKHIDQSERRMVGQEMPTALFAVLPLTDRRLLERANVLGTSRDPERRRLPKRKSIHGTARPRAARSAVAIAHALRLARDLDLNGTAETFALVGHCCAHLNEWFQQMMNGRLWLVVVTLQPQMSLG